MKHKNCRECLAYDEFIDMQLTPCDEEEAFHTHYCVSYRQGIPKDIWRGKQLCPCMLKENEK